MTDEQLVEEVRSWLAANWNPREKVQAESFGRSPYQPLLEKVLAAGYAVPSWPKELGGRALSPAQGRLIEREFAAVSAPGAGQDRHNLWANTALAYATPEFRDEIVPKLLTGAVGMCLLYSEPGAGSDLAAVRTRADLEGDQYRVNGQKVWTSGAAIADYGMLIARTDWDAPKHLGISFFFLPMKQPGIEVRPLRQITDEAHFNEVFIPDALVPAANLLVNTVMPVIFWLAAIEAGKKSGFWATIFGGLAQLIMGNAVPGLVLGILIGKGVEESGWNHVTKVMMSAIVLLFVLSGFFRGFDMKLIESFHLGVPLWLENVHNLMSGK